MWKAWWAGSQGSRGCEGWSRDNEKELAVRWGWKNTREVKHTDCWWALSWCLAPANQFSTLHPGMSNYASVFLTSTRPISSQVCSFLWQWDSALLLLASPPGSSNPPCELHFPKTSLFAWRMAVLRSSVPNARLCTPPGRSWWTCPALNPRFLGDASHIYILCAGPHFLPQPANQTSCISCPTGAYCSIPWTLVRGDLWSPAYFPNLTLIFQSLLTFWLSLKPLPRGCKMCCDLCLNTHFPALLRTGSFLLILQALLTNDLTREAVTNHPTEVTAPTPKLSLL